MLYPIELLRHTRRQQALHETTASMLTTDVPFVMRSIGLFARSLARCRSTRRATCNGYHRAECKVQGLQCVTAMINS